MGNFVDDVQDGNTGNPFRMTFEQALFELADMLTVATDAMRRVVDREAPDDRQAGKAMALFDQIDDIAVKLRAFGE